MKRDFQSLPYRITYRWLCLLLWFGLCAPVAIAQQLDDNNPVEIAASYQVIANTDQGLLTIQARLADDWYIYSTTQPPGGPLRTKVTSASTGVTFAGELKADREPKQVTGELGFEDIVVEKHFDRVTWTVPLKFAQSQGNESLAWEIKFSGQVCSSACIPLNKKLPVKFAGIVQQEVASQPSMAAASSVPLPPTDFQDPKGHVGWGIGLSSQNAKPGEQVLLRLRAKPDDGYHLYVVEEKAKETAFHTCIIIDEKRELSFGPPTTTAKWIEQSIGADQSKYHDGEVTWEVPIRVPVTASMGPRRISGLVGYQACTDSVCDQPLAIRFDVTLEVSDKPAGPVVCELKAVPFSQVSKSPVRLTWFENEAGSSVPVPAVVPNTEKASNPDKNGSGDPRPTDASTSNSSPPAAVSPLSIEDPIFDLDESSPAQQSTWVFFGFALIGGFFLNFMPCVLPVIGLKIMSFMQEGDGSTKRFIWLNLCYVFGIMAVMMFLGAATVIAKNSGESLSWGEHFGDPRFRLAILVLIFSMALSFLGIWEIPIPGFAMSKTSSSLMNQEGPTGAFFKGALTTILATPCTGPFLGTALSVTLTQSNTIILCVFFFIGLGLGLPYLAIAAYPEARKWIPKPGAWMDTFKQLLAFPLLFTTVFILAFFPDEYRIAAMTTLVGVWFACWLIGKVPPYYELQARLAGWCTALLVALMVGWGSFQWLGPVDESADNHIAWEPYSEERLQELKKAGKTVLIDFTASWCLNCKTNLKFSIETNKVAQQIRDNKVVALIADWSDTTSPQGEAIQAKLDALKCNGIPVLAVYSPKQPNRPYVLRELIPESTVLKALDRAGPSKQ